jgi:hypothetical protein
MSTFQRLSNGKVLYTDEDGRVHALNPNASLLPDKDNPYLIIISDQVSTYHKTGFYIDSRFVTIPINNNRNDLIGILANDFFFNNIELRTQTLENNEFIIRVFTIIGTSQTGRIEIPQGCEIALDLFPHGIDALALMVDEFNRPIDQLVQNTAGADIAVSLFDSNGNYNLTAVPATPAALRYFLKTTSEFLQNIPLGNRDVVTQVGFNSGDTYIIKGSSNKQTSNRFLEQNGVFMNLTPDIIPFEGYIRYISACSEFSGTWNAVIYKNNSPLPGAVLNMVSQQSKTAIFNIPVSTDDKISLYAQGSNIQKPCIYVTIKKS